MTPSDISPRIHRSAGQGAERTCWRMAAIYRVCVRQDVTRAWVLRRIREVFPCGTRDNMADIYMMSHHFMKRTRLEKARATAACDVDAARAA